MTKSARINLRATTDAKARWESAAKAKGLALSEFIEQTIEASLEDVGGGSPEGAGLSGEALPNTPSRPTSSSAASENFYRLITGDDLKITGSLLDPSPPSPDESHGTSGDSQGRGGGRLAPVLSSACPRLQFHRPGLWCKGCSKFIKK